MSAYELISAINQQYLLSSEVAGVILNALIGTYYDGLPADQIGFGEIGSYGRGTNNDTTPDIDIMYLGIPNDPQLGFFDWREKGTYEITQTREGITTLAQVQKYDPKLARAIKASMQSMEGHFNCEGEAKFNFVRSWTVFPGVVFNFSLPVPGHGILDFDINLYHPVEYFGLEHARRFVKYFERVKQELGSDRAAQLILDIRQFKKTAKDIARDSRTGKIDPAKKVTGVVVETLFVHKFPPPDRTEVAREILKLKSAAFPPTRTDTDYIFPIQVIDEGLSFKDVLDAGWECGLLAGKRWETLLETAKELIWKNETHS
jgi:hypothetical protein